MHPGMAGSALAHVHSAMAGHIAVALATVFCCGRGAMDVDVDVSQSAPSERATATDPDSCHAFTNDRDNYAHIVSWNAPEVSEIRAVARQLITQWCRRSFILLLLTRSFSFSTPTIACSA